MDTLNLDSLYREILVASLTAIRDAAVAGDIERCRAEAEHAHNIPSLIGEANKHRHLYYVSEERTAYLEWVFSTKRKDLMEFVSLVYLPCWNKMDEYLGIDGIQATRPK